MEDLPICSSELSFKSKKIAEINHKIVSFQEASSFQDPQCQVKYLSFFRIAGFLTLGL